MGASLTLENVALPGLRFATAFMLSYDGSPLAVIAFVDRLGTPVLLCIVANNMPDAPTRSQQRDYLSLAWSSRGARTHVVIGRIPRSRRSPWRKRSKASLVLRPPRGVASTRRSGGRQFAPGFASPPPREAALKAFGKRAAHGQKNTLY